MTIPLSLYIHIPWCVRKCPYCDFNSHTLKDQLPEELYIQALLQDLQNDLHSWPCQREIQSIFFGGGTPSLFSAKIIARLLEELQQHLTFAPNIEITLEANPGTVEQQHFAGFKQAGINRLSIGVQSFQAEKLTTLGRIHNQEEAITAINAAKKAGFSNFNIDLMYGLPKQTVEDALFDLKTAVSLEPTHLSWYQLTLEPNTPFYHHPPALPTEEITWEIYERGSEFLENNHFKAYEVSAFHRHDANTDFRCKHNLNYWSFGDYLGIGAGAHGKLTMNNGDIIRYWKPKHPKQYLKNPIIAEQKTLSAAEIPFEFMMNALRLYQDIPFAWLERVGIYQKDIQSQLNKAKALDLLDWNEQGLRTTAMGKRFLNELLQVFL